MKSTVDPEADVELILLVYVGQRISSDDKQLNNWWMEIRREEMENIDLLPLWDGGMRGRCYPSKEVAKQIGYGVGNVFQVEQRIGGTAIFAATAEYQGRIADQKQLEKWQCDNREQRTTFDLRKRAKKEGEVEFESLMHLRSKYKQLVSRQQKASLLANFIAFITG